MRMKPPLLTLKPPARQRGKTARRSVDLSGGVLYAANQGSFYLTNIEVEQLSIQGVSQEYTDRVPNLVDAALTDYCSSHLAYRLENGDFKQVAATLLLKDVIVENNELIVTLGI